MENLHNKKVLFFAPNFFGYEIEIKKTLQKFGALVDYFDERPKNNFITKASIRINRNLVLRKLKNYYESIHLETKSRNYDYVLVVGMEAMLPDALKKIKENHPNAILILYMWDSLQNKKYASDCLPFFDYISSFDKKDVVKLPGMRFRPLFFIQDYERLSKSKDSKSHADLCFIGTVHSDRYNLIKSIESQLSYFGLKSNLYMYLSSRKLFLYKKISDLKFRSAKLKEFKFKSLTHNSVVSLIDTSKVVLDIQHPSQTGLTMRTIEMLGAGKKLITTNSDIRNYDFYNEANILVVDRINPIINANFFKIPYQDVPQKIREQYSIEGWLSDLFTLK